LWKPQKKQEIFLSRFEDEALYGGAAGGGKSDALLAEALRQVHIGSYRGLLLRKTFPECRELIDRSHQMYKTAFPNAVYSASSHVWTFASGAKIYFGSMQHPDDKVKYQGQQYDFIGFDELTHFTWGEYSYLFSRNRPSGKGTRCYIRATCNPGGVGHGWVKERFIEGKEPLKTYYETVTVQGKTYRRSRVFVPSTVFDNQILLENHPDYIASLAILPESEKRALLYGDWNSFNGQVFSEFRNCPENGRTYTHVIKPFEIPEGWRRWRSFDFGYSRPFAVQWWAVDYDGRAYLYRQLYGCTDTPNTGVRWEPVKIAEKIREIEEEEEKGHNIYGVADPSIWDTSRGTDGTIITMFERKGVYFEKGNNARVAGKMQLHYRLRFDSEGYPMLYVFDTCKPFLRTIGSLVHDSVNPEDIDTRQEDHDYDACRYFLMTNPITPKPFKKEREPQFNPLNL
jgi:hypothetical protein